MSTVFRRLPLGGKAAIFQAVKTYRPGQATCAAPALAKMSVAEALVASKTKVTFLEAETLKGLPVSTEMTTKTIDPYFACYIKDLDAAFFGK
mmetsp:Transcript_6011/g.17797  ORF Transcript_6011/g.17797 Transcript_6011/m.17797 type:complete len:92 (+) Transcript_6011:61-336(+)